MTDTTREELRSMFASAWQDGVHHLNPSYSRRDTLFTDRAKELIQSEITKAQEQLLDELEAKALNYAYSMRPGASRTIKIVPVSTIETMRKHIREVM